jgi:hypothetical protein
MKHRSACRFRPCLAGVLALVGCGGATENPRAAPGPNADAGSDGGNPPDAGPGDARYDAAVVSEEDCPVTGGWFAAYVPGGASVTLCPALCEEHLGPPGVPFVLEWTWTVGIE